MVQQKGERRNSLSTLAEMRSTKVNGTLGTKKYSSFLEGFGNKTNLELDIFIRTLATSDGKKVYKVSIFGGSDSQCNKEVQPWISLLENYSTFISISRKFLLI